MPTKALALSHSCQPPRRIGLARRLLALISLSRQRQSLRLLDDRLLEDIGLTRNDAESEAARPVWDTPLHWQR